MLQWLHTHVSSVCFKCFTCFRLMLQVFHLDVAKVDLDVAYVAMTIHACFKHIFQVHLFQTYVAVFYLDVLNVDLGEYMFHMLHSPYYYCWGHHRASA
jgi:hypothetical protein